MCLGVRLKLPPALVRLIYMKLIYMSVVLVIGNITLLGRCETNIGVLMDYISSQQVFKYVGADCRAAVTSEFAAHACFVHSE